jgi:hypothetical protein
MGYEAGECAFSTDKINLGAFDFVWKFLDWFSSAFSGVLEIGPAY